VSSIETENKENGDRSEEISRLVETAYHEAGHAVVCFLNKIPIKMVTIIPSEDFLGRVEQYPVYRKEFNLRTQSYKYVKSEVFEFSETKLMKRIMVSLAGDVAINILKNESAEGASVDYQNAGSYAFNNCGSLEEAEALINYLWYKTYNNLKIDFNWILVETLANQLLEKKEISGRKVKKILEDTRADFTSKVVNLSQITFEE
jgi:DNA-binding ferritin-like protein (Dps family)